MSWRMSDSLTTRERKVLDRVHSDPYTEQGGRGVAERWLEGW